jgi:tetratricopeptide (TPR) repeat protein
VKLVFFRIAVLVFLVSTILLLPACQSSPFNDYIGKGDSYMEEKNWSAAIAEYQKALAIDSKSTSVRRRIGVAYNNEGWDYNQKQEWDQALKDFNSALENYPNYAIAYNNRGVAYDGKGQLSLNKAYQFINNGDLDNGLKEVEKAIGFFGQAIDDLKKALAVKSGFNEAKNNLANAYNDRGHCYDIEKLWDTAISDLSNAIDLNSELARAYNDRCWAYDGKKDWDKAIADCNKAIQLDPNMALAYNNRGWAFHQTDKYSDALVDLTKAINLSPDLSVAYLNRAITYYYLQNKNAAIDDCNMVFKLTKDPDQVIMAKQILALLGVPVK